MNNNLVPIVLAGGFIIMFTRGAVFEKGLLLLVDRILSSIRFPGTTMLP